MREGATMKPMLASAAGPEIFYPVFVSPKLDGVRCLIIDGVAVSRNLKPIPNLHVQKLFGTPVLNGLDGELIVGVPTAPDVFQATTSGVMSRNGEPDVRFHVFDDFSAPGGFQHRLRSAAQRISIRQTCVLVPHLRVAREQELTALEESYLKAGYEGVMLRNPGGPYKFGRSTLREGWLLKLKRFVDSEAVVIDTTELMHNTNEAVRDELGRKKRSSHKAGKIGKGSLGALVVRDLENNVEFDVGTGFTEAQRATLWAERESLIGRFVKYKSQPTGVKDKPRFPVFLGFRDPDDM